MTESCAASKPFPPTPVVLHAEPIVQLMKYIPRHVALLMLLGTSRWDAGTADLS